MAITLDLKERSYGGKKFRPQTQIYHEKESNLVICVTCWGRDEIAEQVTESIKNFIMLASEDTDLTVPYTRKDNLHQQGNILRMAVIMASEKIFNQHNRDEYTCGFEIFAAVQEGPQWIFVSCGQPSLVLYRKGQGPIPVTHSLDINVLTAEKSTYDPLPNHLLGLGQHPPIIYGNIRINKGDKLALVSRAHLPSHFFSLDFAEFEPQTISRILATDSEHTPFWLGFIQVK
jgi:hypothetical protein